MNEASSNDKREQLLAAMVYAEGTLGRRGLRPAEIRDLFVAARLSPPASPSAMLTALLKSKSVIRMAGKGQPQYVLMATVRERFSAPPGKGGRRPNASGPFRDLAIAIRALPDGPERDYLEESALCLEVGALRLGLVGGWSAAMANLRGKVIAAGLSGFNAEYQRLYPQSKKQTVRNVHDFENYRDEEFLQVLPGMGLLPKSVATELVGDLKLRNSCGHVSGVKPGANKVRAYFEELFDYVFNV